MEEKGVEVKTKILKGGAKLGQGVRALKKMGGWKPLSSYQLILEFVKAPFLVLHFCMATVDCCRKRLVVLIALVRLM